MIKNLPNLLDRNFVLAFLLPSFVFIYFSDSIVDALPGQALQQSTDLLLYPTIRLAIAGLGCGLVLLALNQKLIRFFEGYGRWNPLGLLLCLEKTNYRRIQRKLEDIKIGKAPDAGRKGALMRRLSEEFPDEERHVLPTRFGNIVRSFEVYPRVMYGLEGVQGWDRIYLLLSKENRTEVDAAKTQVDLWINTLFLSSILLVEYIISAVGEFRYEGTWIPAALLLSIWFSKESTKSAALEWGELVKSIFDVYLGDLQEKLGLPGVESESKQREIWKRYSQAIIYRRPDVLPKL